MLMHVEQWMRAFRTGCGLWFPVVAGGLAPWPMPVPGRWLIVGIALLLGAMVNPARAQISDERPPPGYYSPSGACGLEETVITFRDAGHEVNLQFDALGQLMIVDVMLALDGVVSPYGGRVFGGYSYFSSPTGYQLKENEAVFTVTGRSGPGAHGIYFDYGSERWFGFAEWPCEDPDWLAALRRKTGPFLADIIARGDIDIGVRIDLMGRLVERALRRPVN